MIKIKEKLRQILVETIEKYNDIDIDINDIDIEVPNNPEFGDFSSNITMRLSNKMGIPPMELGEKICRGLENKYSFIDKVKVIRPGFINFYLKKDYLNKNIVENIEEHLFVRYSTNENEPIKICIVLEYIREIFRLEDFRALMNMYYLGNIYEAKGHRVEKHIIVKKYERDIKASYLLSNFKNIKISSNIENLKQSIVFCSPENQWLFKNIENKRFIVDRVRVYDNNIEVYEITLTRLIEILGINRLKFTMITRPINSELDIEITRDYLRNVQYPYSRISTVTKNLKEERLDLEDVEVYKWELLESKVYQDLIIKLPGYIEAIESSTQLNDPHRLIKYIKDITHSFNELNNSILYRKLNNDKLLVLLKLLESVKLIFRQILEILEVPMYKKM